VVGFELPKDDEGEVIPHDHPYLADGHRLIRRISDDHIVFDANQGGNRISSALFKCDPRHGYLSIDSERCILDIPEKPGDYISTPMFYGALVLGVDAFRSIDRAAKPADRWKIGIVPVEGNDCHGAVWGKITTGQSNSIQRTSEWLVEVPGVEKLS
jgi:hypothetical protein